MTRPDAELYTIGHSNHPIERFLELLHGNHIEGVADVRSRPYSRFVPHFSKERLERILAEEDIGYLFLGRELGGRPPRDDPGGSPANYRERMADPRFLHGIERLLNAAGGRRTALLCRERDPLDCHRLYLICRYLRGMVGSIRHVLHDGSIEEQPATERRLIERAEERQLGLFDDPGGAALEQAYDSWWQRHGP